jgi:protein-tyrosine-phosphatase
MSKTRVLFVCVENAGRSQMAEAFARKLGGTRIEAWSAGSKPSGRLNPLAVEVMKERGFDLSGHHCKSLDELPPLPWDYVITMGCGDACPFVPSKARLDWSIPDPKGGTKDQVARIADIIERSVSEWLSKEIEVKR